MTSIRSKRITLKYSEIGQSTKDKTLELLQTQQPAEVARELNLTIYMVKKIDHENHLAKYKTSKNEPKIPRKEEPKAETLPSKEPEEEVATSIAKLKITDKRILDPEFRKGVQRFKLTHPATITMKTYGLTKKELTTILDNCD